MTKFLSAIPKVAIEKEMEYNRDNLLSVFDKMFDDVFRTSYPDAHRSLGIDPFSKAAYPKVNVISHDTNVEIVAEIAGFTKEDISVELDENVLSIVGKASQQTESTDKSVYLIRELKRSSFSRSFKLSEELDATNIDATFKDGLLKLVIPRKVKQKEATVSKVVIK